MKSVTDDHAAAWQHLTDDERALLLAAKGRGGEILDNPDWAPDCGQLVKLGLVGKYEVALTPAGHALADWVNKRQRPVQVEWNGVGQGWEVRILDMDDQPLSGWTYIPPS